MPKLERGFVPLPLAHTENIHFNLALPDYVAQERIGVNLRKISRLMNVVGIRRFEMEVVDEANRSTPAIEGFDSQGNAFASITAERVPDVTTEKKSVPGSTFWKLDQQTDLKVRLSLINITERVANLRSEQSWAEEIDRAVKEALRKEGRKQLIFESVKRDLKFAAITLSARLTILHANTFGLSLQDLDSVGGVLSQYIALDIGRGIWKTTARLFGNHPRFSFFLGPQFDRVALLQTMSRSRKTVKQIS